MSATPIEVGAMRRAVALSALGLATTSPNPPVGCVILDSAGRVVGEGYHERKGEPHAEAQALAAAGDRAADGTAIVTLEPCNHHGRTPPCHQALIDAGVTRVVIAVLDPTSRREGGAALLRAAGISVQVGVLAAEALLVVGPWLAALHRARPQVTWAYHLGPKGVRAVPDDLVAVSALRSGFDAVLHDDRSIEEGIPGTHGQHAFSLPPTDVNREADAFLASLYAGGTRTLLVHGGIPLARPFLDAALIDEIRAYLSAPASAEPRLSEPLDWPLVPPEFHLQHVRKLTAAVVIEAVANTATSRPDLHGEQSEGIPNL